MSKHTPGPWEQSRMLLSPKAKDRRCGFVVNGPDKPDDLPTRICDLRVPQGVSGFEEGEANAKLIAAAPELLSTEATRFYNNHAGDTAALMTALDAAGIPSNQDWDNELTTWTFEDGSEIVVSGSIVSVYNY